MRKALNENPLVQIGMLAALGVLVAVVFMTRMGGGGAESEAADEPTEAATPAAGTATPAAAPEATPSGAAPALTPASASGAAPFKAGKGLPAPMVDAYEAGDVVVLYLMQQKGVEDQLVERHVELLRSRKDTTVFVSDVKDVSRYSRIAEGVSLNRVPAMVVLQPLRGKLAKGENPPLPAATVSYGFRNNASVKQAVRDALYQGKQVGYDPG
jgi:hypothetical protein